MSFCNFPYQIYKMYTSRCSENTDCASCVGAEDPYCGWCSLEGR